MKIVAPSYYPAFRCIADRCQHSCCIGWEIDIDPAAVNRYRAVGGDFGKRLMSSMTVSTEGDTCFALTADERCPFLNERGLCDIITTLGEDALCQICADHPRFRNPFSSHTEMGVGLCCEAAADLILRQTEPFSLTVITDDGKPFCPTDNERRFLRERRVLLNVATDRRYSLKARERRLLALVGRRPKPLSAKALYAIYAPLERLDPSWSHTLCRLQESPSDSVLADLAVPYENLLCYFLFRHTASATDNEALGARVAFAVHSVRLLRLLAPEDIRELCDLARAYSAEIEYSDENLEALFAAF